MRLVVLRRPSCIRFPRGNGTGVDLASEGITPDLKGTPMPVGRPADQAIFLFATCCLAALTP